MEERVQEVKDRFSGLKNFYDKQYKKLLIIPFALLFIAIMLISFKYAATGDFVNRDVSLKGGVTITIPTENEVDITNLENSLKNDFPKNDLRVRVLSQFGRQIGISIEADITESEFDLLLQKTQQKLGLKLSEKDYTVEIVGGSLGASFFRETLFALLIAFLFMGIVVFLYFRTFVPSMAVILAAFSDIVVTLAIINLLGIKLSTAGIAAFLMLIGYSVDTDILLSTRVLKRKDGTVQDRILGSIKTGIMMSLTTIVASLIGLLFAQSDVIKQIMVIILIGLLVDMIFTWIQNVGLLKLYLERKEKKQSHY